MVQVPFLHTIGKKDITAILKGRTFGCYEMSLAYFRRKSKRIHYRSKKRFSIHEYKLFSRYHDKFMLKLNGRHYSECKTANRGAIAGRMPAFTIAVVMIFI